MAAGTSIWAKNGGLYFGLTVAPQGKPERPLEGKEAEASVAPGVKIKTTWSCATGEHRYSADRHVLTIGPNGSGKTRKLLMPNLFRLGDWSCVVIDPKGELAAHTAVWRAAQPGHKVVVIDPFGVVEANYPHLFAKHSDLLRSHGFNPLAALDPENPYFVDDAKALAVALIRTDQSHEPYWPMAAQALVKGLLMVLRVKYGALASLGRLRDILGLAPKKLANFNEQRLTELGQEFPAIAASLSEFVSYSPDDRELSAIRRTAKVQTDWLDSPAMKKDLQGPAIDFSAIKEQPTTIYLVLPPERLATHGVWLRLMVTSILLPLLRSVEAAPVPVLFMLDEFAQLGHMEVIQENYALMRGFGIKLWTIWQDLTQAKRLYKEQWESFISNAGIVHTFAPQDLTTRDYLSQLSGERIIWHSKTSTSGNLALGGSLSLGSSQNDTHIIERVMKPHELAALDQDEAVLFTRRGLMHLAILPQPEYLPGVGEALEAARHEIEGADKVSA
ncbi:MAG TPA: type IV secretory system conjugative DNA transfer family protein [Methylocella sp.]|jgi:type IV secretion system protein VirD4|nr:type IV secretory system conjugative DNA transfer family protein [Methylocella sp.]